MSNPRLPRAESIVTVPIEDFEDGSASPPSDFGALRNDAASSICIDEYDRIDDVGLARTAQAIVDNADAQPPVVQTDYENYVQRVARDILNSEAAAPRRLRFDATSNSAYIPMDRSQHSTDSSRDNFVYPDDDDLKMCMQDRKQESTPPREEELASYNRPKTAAFIAVDEFYGEMAANDYNETGHHSNRSFAVTSTTDQSNSIGTKKHGAFVTVHDAASYDSDDQSSMVTLNIDTQRDEIGGQSTTRLARTFRQTDFLWLAFSGGMSLTALMGADNIILVSGPLGSLLGNAIVIPIVLGVVTSLAEMVAFYPFENGYAAMVSEYADRSLGFALGILYWAACATAVPGEILMVLRLVNTNPVLRSSVSGVFVWLTFFLGVMLIVGMCTARITSRAFRYASMFSALCLFIIMVFLWVVDAGGAGSPPDRIGFRYWDPVKSQADLHYGPFRPRFFKMTGATGRFFQVWHACEWAIGAFNGLDIIYTAMPEIRNSRRAMKASIRNIYLRIGLFHVLLIFTYTLVTDPNVMEITVNSLGSTMRGITGEAHICKSSSVSIQQFTREGVLLSWFVSLGRQNLCSALRCIIAFFVFSGLFSASLRLYGATRTLHGMAAEGLIPRVFAYCTRDNVPVMAVFTTLLVSLLAYAGVAYHLEHDISWLERWSVGTYMLAWAVFCLTYLRFYRAIQKKKHSLPINRSDEDYPYRSPLQPYTAWFSMIACLVLYACCSTEIQAATRWRAGLLIYSYAPIVLFVVLYVGHKLIFRTKVVPYHRMELDAAKRRMDHEEWEEDRVYSEGFRETLVKTYRWAQRNARSGRKRKSV